MALGCNFPCTYFQNVSKHIKGKFAGQGSSDQKSRRFLLKCPLRFCRKCSDILLKLRASPILMFWYRKPSLPVECDGITCIRFLFLRRGWSIRKKTWGHFLRALSLLLDLGYYEDTFFPLSNILQQFHFLTSPHGWQCRQELGLIEIGKHIF